MDMSNGYYSDMDAPPPPLLLEHQQQQQAPNLDNDFGNLLCLLMDGQMTAEDAIFSLQQLTGSLVSQYRSEAADELVPAARRLNLARMAAELEGQAATWQLLQATHCSDQFPAGTYEGAPNVGDRLSARQHLADIVQGDHALKRFAQVVTWLEGLASQQLPQDQVRLAANFRFGAQDGVWKDTLRGLGGHSRHAADTELDPDAVSRDQLKLARGDQQNEQRLAQWVWKLVRAGRYKDACDLCANAGQSWRAVSLAGAGTWGPLPVGDAALKASQGADTQDPSEEIACEVEGGAATARLAWKWTCLAAAAAAGPSNDGEGGNKFESALYGALCGDVRAMLPACETWEDEAWAYCRAWLELQSDSTLLQACKGSELQAGAQEYYLGHAGDSSEAEIPLDMLEGFVDLAASSGYSKHAPSKHLLREGLAVMNGDWPLQRLAIAGNQVLVPTNFRELYDLLSSSSNSNVAAAAKQDQHILQLHLMSEDWVNLVSQLNSTTHRASEQLQEFAQQQGPGGPMAASRGMVGDVSMGLVEYGGQDDMGYEGSATDAAGSSEAALDVLRFNAHMALALRALGLLPDPITRPWEDHENLLMLQAVCSKVIQAYATYLASQRDLLGVVPAFLCHLRLPERRNLARTMINTALDQFVNDSDGEYLCGQLIVGTGFWYAHQNQPQVEDSPKHNLFGDLRLEEARLLLQYNVFKTFSDSATSPKRRCDTLRWMLYGFLAAMRKQQGEQQEEQPEWEGCWADALSNSLGLATQLALNPGAGGPALAYLLLDVIPDGFAEVATHAAIAAAGLDAGDAAAAAGAAQESSAVSRALGVDVIEPAGQLQVQRQLLALGFWRCYAEIEARYQAWKQARSDLLQGGGFEEPGFPLEDAVVLVQDMLGLARQDALQLDAPEWLAQSMSRMNQAAAAGAGGGAPAVTEGARLCMPQYDAPVNPLLMQGSAEGTVEQVLGLQPYSTLQLAVTVASYQPGISRLGGAADARDIEQPYNTLQPREVQVLQASVDAFLQAAMDSCPDVAFKTSIPDPDDSVTGGLLVALQCYSSSNSGSSSRVLNSRELQAWQDMVSVAVSLMDAGSKRGALGGSGGSDGYDENDGPAVPRLCVTYLDGSLSTQLAISRRRTTSKLLRRSAKVLSVLTRQGHRGPEVDSLLECASEGDDRQGLLSQLSQGDAAALLDTLTEILAEVQDGAR